MTDLPSLLARIESAIGPDRELDVHIHAALGLNAKYPDNAAVGDLKHWLEFAVHEKRESPYHFLGPFTKSKEIGRYTASIDDAILLCERVLPGWLVNIQSPWAERPVWTADLHKTVNDGVDERVVISTHRASRALALCAAIVKARMET